jgi:alpha-L-fucosidase
MFEQDLPGENKSGLSFQEISNKMPLESCITMNDSWGFNITDRNYKSTRELIQLLIKDAALGANLLLNIGPLPNGNIQPEFTDRLDSMGNWLKTYGPTIYGTKAGFMRPAAWGAVTRKENKVYLHLFKYDGDRFFLEFPYKVKAVRQFTNKQSLKFQTLPDHYLMIDIHDLEKNDTDRVIEIETEG